MKHFCKIILNRETTDLIYFTTLFHKYKTDLIYFTTYINIVLIKYKMCINKHLSPNSIIITVVL